MSALLVSTAAPHHACAANRVEAHSRGKGVSLVIVPGSGGMGLDLVVRNPTETSLCIPAASLSADSGSLVAHQGAQLFASQRNEEYSSKGYPGSARFYIASKRTTAKFLLDEGGMELAPGIYTFQADVDWLDCARLSLRSHTSPINSPERSCGGR